MASSLINILEQFTRVQIPTLEDAHKYRAVHGGWIVKHEDGRIFHYSYRYCRSDIMKDLPGSFEII